jgi:cellulose biosynthesis protein BcsQ
MGLANHFLGTLSKGERRPDKEFELVGNCFGFYGLSGGLGVSTLAFEVAYLAATQGMHTCYIDASPLSSFGFSKSTKYIENVKDVPSLVRRLRKRSCELSETLVPVNDFLKIMSFGDVALSDTFQMPYDIMLKTFQDAKQAFDLVIIDIQNIPYLEPTIAAVKTCSTLYTVCAPTPETIIKKTKLDNLMALAGIDKTFNNIIFGRVPSDISMINTMEGQISGRILGEYPVVNGFTRAAFSSDSILTETKDREVKNYAKMIDYIMNEIMYGIKGKEDKA